MDSNGDPGPSTPNDSKIEAFLELTQSSEDQAIFYLEACQGELDQAVARFYDEEYRGNAEIEDIPEENGLTAPVTPENRARSPFGVLRGGLNLVLEAFKIASSVLNTLGHNLLPANLYQTLQGLARSINAPRVSNPTEDAQRFCSEFSRQYGEISPDWLETDWNEATQNAHRQFKMLFIYLHSPYHEDTDQFCRNTLATEEVALYINEHFVSWGGDITKSEAFKLSQKLRVPAYPYVCLLAYSGSRVRLAAFAHGNLSPESLLDVLRDVQENQSAQLIADRAEQQERDYNRTLREEQDAAYQRSLQEDRDREEKRRRERDIEENRRRDLEEAEQAERQKKEDEAREAASKVSAVETRQKLKAETLRPEAEVGNSEGTVTVRIRLPDGTNHQRRFLASRPIQDVYDFVDSLESFKVLEYNLVSSYPRKVLERQAIKQSFQEFGLVPQATLFVQSLDD